MRMNQEFLSIRNADLVENAGEMMTHRTVGNGQSVRDGFIRKSLRSSTPTKVCRFSSHEFTGLLSHHGIQIRMDGKGCCRDNVFVERLWKSIKYEEVYLHAYDTIGAAHQGWSGI